MKKRIKGTTAGWFVFLAFGFAVLLGCGSSKEDGSAAIPQKNITDSKELVETKCTICHFSDRIYKDPRDPDEWKALVERMRALNTSWMSDDEANRITKYLTETNSRK